MLRKSQSSKAASGTRPLTSTPAASPTRRGSWPGSKREANVLPDACRTFDPSRRFSAPWPAGAISTGTRAAPSQGRSRTSARNASRWSSCRSFHRTFSAAPPRGIRAASRPFARTAASVMRALSGPAPGRRLAALPFFGQVPRRRHAARGIGQAGPGDRAGPAGAGLGAAPRRDRGRVEEGGGPGRAPAGVHRGGRPAAAPVAAGPGGN